MTRIIAGAAGSLRLEVPKSGTRPTSDRVREAVFSTLGSWNMLEGSRVLDLYAGSGALGLEAASRGASSVALVEKHAQAAQVAARNAKTVAKALGGGSAPDEHVPEMTVARQSVRSYIENTSVTGVFDVVFIDPPYDLGEAEVEADLAVLVPLLADDAVVMVERSTRTPEPGWPEGLQRIKEKRYGETVLWWAERVA